MTAGQLHPAIVIPAQAGTHFHADPRSSNPTPLKVTRPLVLFSIYVKN